MVPTLTIVFIVINIIFAFGLPIGLGFFLWKKFKASWMSLLAGVIVFPAFAMVLESLFKNVLAATPLGTVTNFWVIALVSGLCAGLFEETGRFLAMKFCLKKYYKNPYNAVMYGVGHGGIEVILIFGVAMFNNLIYATMINSGTMDAVMKTLPLETRSQLLAVVNQLVTVPSGTFLFGMWERLSAVLGHIGMSVIVWIAVTKLKTWLFPVAILCHTLFDGIMVVCIYKGMGTVGIEVVISVIAIVIAALAVFLWKTNPVQEEADSVQEEADPVQTEADPVQTEENE